MLREQFASQIILSKCSTHLRESAMHIKLLAATVSGAVLSSAAYAQAPAAAAPTRDNAAATQKMTHKGEWRASKVIGLDVYNQQDDKIGDINEILMDSSGKVVGYVIGVGGFLGMGEHDVLMTPDKIKFMEEPRQARSAATDRRPADSNRPAGTAAAPAPATTGAASPAPANRQANRDDDKWYPDHAVVNATKDQLKALPEFKYSNYN